MKEFIDKLIGRLEEELKLAEIDRERYLHGNSTQFNYGKAVGYGNGMSNAIEISNQLAEEYNKESVKGDLISRQTVLEVLEKSFNNYAIPWCKNAFSIKIKNEIISIPTTYSDGWIPCSLKMPDYLDSVLVCTKIGGRTIAHLKHTPIEWRDMYMNKIDDVIAWKYLDAPYQPKGE